jgi:predicted amidohydrolase
VRAALAQLCPTPRDAAANAQRAAALVADHREADLVALPELFLSGYDLADPGTAAVDPEGPELGRIRAAAAEAGTAVLVGFAERRGGAPANAAACIDETGALVAVYRKVFLFGQETGAFEPGDELVLATLAGRRVGPLICFDMEFPEPARALARAGAEVLITVSANMEPFLSDHLIAGQARALDNRLAHLYVNRCGEEAGLRFVGGTRALRPDGTVEAALDDDEGILVTTLGAPGVEDDRVDYLAHARDDLPVRAPTTAPGGSTP